MLSKAKGQSEILKKQNKDTINLENASNLIGEVNGLAGDLTEENRRVEDMVRRAEEIVRKSAELSNKLTEAKLRSSKIKAGIEAKKQEVAPKIAEIEKKIKELEITLKNAVVITTSSTNLGKKIKFEVIGVNEPDLFGDGEFLLVSSIESNPFDPVTPKISNESQLGSALMKAKIGDEIQISNDNVFYTVKILDIE